MPKFRKGDRVRVGTYMTLIRHIGLIGTVLEDDAEPFIEFDVDVVNGNDACGEGKKGHCYAYSEVSLELVKANEVPYNLDTLTEAIKSVKMHDKDEFMLLNMIDMIKEA